MIKMKYEFEFPEMPHFKFEVVNAWFQEHFRDKQRDILPKFLELNEKFPVGINREIAYIELMEEHIEKAGFLAKYVQETQGKAETAVVMWDAHMAKIKELHEHHSKFIQQITNGHLESICSYISTSRLFMMTQQN